MNQTYVNLNDGDGDLESHSREDPKNSSKNKQQIKDYPYWGNQAREIYGNFQGFDLKHIALCR